MEHFSSSQQYLNMLYLKDYYIYRLSEHIRFYLETFVLKIYLCRRHIFFLKKKLFIELNFPISRTMMSYKFKEKLNSVPSYPLLKESYLQYQSLLVSCPFQAIVNGYTLQENLRPIFLLLIYPAMIAF